MTLLPNPAVEGTRRERGFFDPALVRARPSPVR